MYEEKDKEKKNVSKGSKTGTFWKPGKNNWIELGTGSRGPPPFCI